ncbi:hypothetical protein C2S53_007980 [Perilla frutescens var. hirtella]|uniref:Uncharacterized protein n=1 Tax=Perilla frutescens var. hirtella TaxID=608512 RepID=A0AAD4PAV5_PERFH|nr:hypothetical protein C2S53_007980 [Perilla frutescens var. hirtella]
MSSPIAKIAYLFLFLANSCLTINTIEAQPQPRITVLGSVYCDVCYDNTFSNHSYLLPGVDVNVECKVKGKEEMISFSVSVNRSTDRYGMYRLEIPIPIPIPIRDHQDHQYHHQDPTTTTVHYYYSFCEATLINTSNINNGCTLPTRTKAKASSEIRSAVNIINALSYRPPRRNATLCGEGKGKAADDADSNWNSSKFFLPYFPPYVFPWPPFPQLPPLPPFPQLPPLPPLPPFPQLPPLPPLPQLPPLPSFPFPQNPPPLPFPFPSVPPPPPRTWIPPPPFNFWDPNTWIPHPPPTNPTVHTTTDHP